jgi:hypothetical protein
MKHAILTLFFLFFIGNVFAPQVKGAAKVNRDKSTLFEYLIDIRTFAVQYSIRHIESNGSYTAIGLNKEYGAYQYSIETWNTICKLLFGKILDITKPENQDMVTKARIKRLMKLGYSDQQIASIWNCGHSHWQGMVGINAEGVHYDVPGYVNKVSRLIKLFQPTRHLDKMIVI